MEVRNFSMFQIAFKDKMVKDKINLKKKNFSLIRKLQREDLLLLLKDKNFINNF